MGNKLNDRSTRHDRFHQKAKREGFLARAVYKLEEIDAKHAIFDGGTRVLDLGCAPGSWLQYAQQRIGEPARLVGLDRTLIDRAPRGARILAGDVLTISVAELLGDLPAFDVVLSDMAPDTTGVRHVDQARSEALFERALDIATQVLAPGGNFVGKLFQGPDFKQLTETVRARFAVQKTAKPASSRQISIEQYVIGKGFRGQAALGSAPDPRGTR
ncbi:MAG TPA: RlmE family RNA methyltransferase [Kofleriaceae bacterium]|jgi:23S rRNA (uridine2552-2'-O)-methyltransferase|nr:RlmE family RNA methyltransferase [Kofleriaceae bacterium]